MYQKVLVAYNGSAESQVALRECMRLAPSAQAEVHLLVVVDPPPYLLVGEYAAAAVLNVEEELAAEKEKMRSELNHGYKLLTDSGLNVRTHLEIGDPVMVIAELVDKLGIELVIVGHSRHKPLALRWWRGSKDALLVEKIRCSLLVASDPNAAAPAA
jgi:nucleotide-binding universal stress UspA family protein